MFTHTPYRYITSAHDLAAAIDALSEAPSLAVDLEFDNNRNGYGVQLALLQIAGPIGDVYLIDPLPEKLDLDALFRLLENESNLKLVHSSGEDLRLFHRLGCYPRPLHDTDLTARLLDYEQPSLQAMLEIKLGVTLDKGAQASNWLRRPLTEVQLRYAALDVAYLHPLYDALQAEAAARGLSALVAGEQTALGEVRYTVDEDPDLTKPADRHAYNAFELHLLRALLRHRDEEARRLGKPPYMIMDDALLRQMIAGDLTPAGLQAERRLHPEQRTGAARRAWEAVLQQAGDEADAQRLSTEPPRRERRSTEEMERKDRVEAARETVFVPLQKALAQQYGTYAARCLLSNRMVDDLLWGHTAWQDLPDTRRALFEELGGAPLAGWRGAIGQLSN